MHRLLLNCIFYFVTAVQSVLRKVWTVYGTVRMYSVASIFIGLTA